MKTLVTASLLNLVASGAFASGWVPADCPSGSSKESLAFEREVRTAIPSSMVYVPRPFPTSEADILEDLKHQYFRIWKNTKKSDIPKEELPLLDGLEEGTLRFRVEKVVNWTPLRCHSKWSEKFSHLVRIYQQNGEEIARFVLNQSGLWGQYEHVPQDTSLKARWKEVLPALPTALVEVKSRYGIQGAQAQYVTTVAGTVRCSPTQPCVAFQAQGKMYLLDKAEWGGLYEFTAKSPGLSKEEIARRAREGPGATGAGVDIKTTGLLSVGNRWVYGRKVPPL